MVSCLKTDKSEHGPSCGELGVDGGWVHRSQRGTAANANANSNSDVPRKFASEFKPPNLKQKVANSALRRNSLANAEWFCE